MGYLRDMYNSVVHYSGIYPLLAAVTLTGVLGVFGLCGGCKEKEGEAIKPSKPPTQQVQADSSLADSNSLEDKMVALDIKLPNPMFVGTPRNLRSDNLERITGQRRGPFFAPIGTKNLALGKPVSASDEEPIIGELEYITNGDKEAADGSYVELGPLKQHVTIDLGEKSTIYAVVVWHYHKEARIYHDFIVQVSNDPDFIFGVHTLFNNDHNNSYGLGIGKDKEYIETNDGKLIDAKGIQARYIRLHSNGNVSNDLNHYIEVEVYGKPIGEISKQ